MGGRDVAAAAAAGLESTPEPPPAPAQVSELLVYVTIVNSDDKLSQRQWCMYVSDLRQFAGQWAKEVHFLGYSPPEAAWQNACVSFTCHMPLRYADVVEMMRADLRVLAGRWQQESIAFLALAGGAELVKPPAIRDEPLPAAGDGAGNDAGWAPVSAGDLPVGPCRGDERYLDAFNTAVARHGVRSTQASLAVSDALGHGWNVSGMAQANVERGGGGCGRGGSPPFSPLFGTAGRSVAP